MKEEPIFYGSNDNESLSSVTKDFARILKKIRKEKNLTQHDLEERSGLSLRMISDLERGVRQPSLITLIKLSKGLDISLMNLIEQLVREINR